MIALEDLKDMTELEIFEHLVNEYQDEAIKKYDHSLPSEIIDETANIEYKKNKSANNEIAIKKLENMEIIIAYESVGSWGCDSSSFFLLKHKETGKLYEIHGSHCSCHGFEGQLELEETDIESLKYRIINCGNAFYCGGYDENETENQKIVNNFIQNM